MHIKRINIENFIIIKKFIIEWKKDQARVKKEVFINYINDHIYRILLSNDRIIKSFKVIWCQKKNDAFFDFVIVNRVKTLKHSISHHFIIKKITSSPSFFESFLFIKDINVNEFIQFVKSLTLALININNFKNKLTLYTF